MVKAELLYGAEKSQDPEKTIAKAEQFLYPFEIVPFCDRSVTYYAKVRAELEKRGRTIGPNDLVIVATVLGNDGRLVTHNIQEMRRVSGLRLEDWTR